MSDDDARSRRRDELSQGLSRVRARITSACVACQRDPADVALVVVTKTYPAVDVALLAELGVTDVAENRDQEAKAKASAVSEGVYGDRLRWHMIGQLQRNKCVSVSTWASIVESVDRLPLVESLSRAACDRGKPMDVLVQVNLDPVSIADRGGVAPDGVLDLAGAVAESDGLRLRGVMGVAPLAASGQAGDQHRAAAEGFARLAGAAHAVRACWPDATVMSGGMSDDLEVAIAAGSTHVRIGSAVMGPRGLGR